MQCVPELVYSSILVLWYEWHVGDLAVSLSCDKLDPPTGLKKANSYKNVHHDIIIDTLELLTCISHVHHVCTLSQAFCNYMYMYMTLSLYYT